MDAVAESGRNPVRKHQIQSRNSRFPCSADHEQDWQPYPANPYSAACDGHTYTSIMHMYRVLVSFNSRQDNQAREYSSIAVQL